MTETISRKTIIEKDVTSEDGVKTIRANLETKEDADAWVKNYSERTNTEWIVDRSFPNIGMRLLFRKKWYCQRSNRNKAKQNSKRNENCKASINIVVKKLTKGTRRNDPLLCEKPPLQAVITISTQHSHPEGIESLRYLRADDNVRKLFEGYFESGMTATESHNHHESKLSLEDNSAELLANARKNPTERTVRHFYNLWKQQKKNPQPEIIKSRIKNYKEQGVDVFVSKSENNMPWAILAVTPVMKNAHSLKAFSSVIHVITVVTKRSLSCFVTLLFGEASCGPLPLGVFIHENQTVQAYETAFKLLKENFENCFGNNCAPEYFITDSIFSQKAALHAVWPSSTQLLCQFRLERLEWNWLNKSSSGVPASARRCYFNYFKKIMHADSEDNLSMVEFLFYDRVDHHGYKKKMEGMLSERMKEEWILMYRPDLFKGRSFHDFSKNTRSVLKDLIPIRTRNFNAVAIVETAASKWEQYYREGAPKLRKAVEAVQGSEMEEELDEDEVEIQRLSVEKSPPSPSCYVEITDPLVLTEELSSQGNESNTASYQFIVVNDSPVNYDDGVKDDKPEGEQTKTDCFRKSALLSEIGRILDLADRDVMEIEGEALLKRLQTIERQEDATEAMCQISSSVKKRKME